MTVGLRCEHCSRFDPNTRFYSFEQADQAALWEHWSCPSCGHNAFVLTSSARAVPPHVTAAQRRLSAVLRALGENLGPHLSVSDLTDDAIVALDRTICALVQNQIPAPMPHYSRVDTGVVLAGLPPMVKAGTNIAGANFVAVAD